MKKHIYLSTGCEHGDEVLPDGRTGHQYCQGETGAMGDKIPAQCKFCAAPCTCPCHDAPVCSRCHGHSVVPDWSDWDERYGEPKPKPCPECKMQRG